MSGVGRKVAFDQLSAVPGVDEELDGIGQCVDGARETARGPGQPGKIVTQLGIIPFHRVGLALVVHRLMGAGIDACLIEGEAITVVSIGVGAGIEQLLQHRLTPLPDDGPTENLFEKSVIERDDVR